MTAKDAAIRVVSDSGSDVGPGQRLREAREAAQLSVAEVASRLRLRPQVLDRLENDDYEQLHGPTFVRGYLSSYARLLDLPERPILEAYERRGYGPPALVSELVRKPEVHISDFPVRMVTYVIAGLLVILVVLWWQSRQPEPGTLERADTAAESVQQTFGPSAIDGGSAESPPAVETTEPPAAEAASEAAGEGETRQPQVAMLDEQTTGSEALHTQPPPSDDAVANEPRPQAETRTESDSPPTAMIAEPAAEATDSSADEPASDAASETADEAARPTEGVVSAPETAGSAEGGATTIASGVEEQTTPAPRPVPLPGSDVLAIQVATESWVEIYDRGGGRLYYNLAREGSEVVVQGAGPMRVLLGEVEGVAVAYNGEPYDLSRYRGRGVVRFTVGELSSTTAPEPPVPAAAEEPRTRETQPPTAEEHARSVANASDALTTPVPEPATPASAPGTEPTPETALPAPAAGGTPQSGLRSTRPDS